MMRLFLPFLLSPAIAAAAPVMSTLIITDAPAGCTVQVDEKSVGQTPLPGPWTLAVGEHTVVFTVNGEARTETITVAAGAPFTLAYPRSQAPTAPKILPADVRVVHTGAGFSLKKAGYISGGVGLVILGGAAFFALQADSLATDAQDLDRSDPSNSRSDLNALNAEAENAAFTANLLYGVGGTALIGGLSLWFLGRDAPTAWHISPTAHGALVRGQF